MNEDLSQKFNKNTFHDSALIFNKLAVSNWELLKACMAREWVLMKRNSFVHAFKSAQVRVSSVKMIYKLHFIYLNCLLMQLVVSAVITMTVFIQTHKSTDVINGYDFLASLFYSLIRFNSNAIPELSMTVSRLAIFHKQRDCQFYPAWAYSIPTILLKIPFSFLDAILWTGLTYYVIGYSPEPGRSVSYKIKTAELSASL